MCKGRGVRVIMRQLGPGMIQQQTLPCDACGQKGFVKNKDKECGDCLGKGIHPNTINKKITVPKNFDYMTKMKLNSYGNYDPETQTTADVFIVFEFTDLDVSGIEVFNQYDLILEHGISIWDALSGYSMHYEHPDGKKYLFKIDDVIKHGDVKYVKNLGLSYSENGSSGKGKLFIKFKYIYPDTVMDSEKLKLWLKTKEKTPIANKSDYRKEKAHSIKENDFAKLYSNQTNNTNQAHQAQQAQQAQQANQAQYAQQAQYAHQAHQAQQAQQAHHNDTSESEDENGGRAGPDCHVQ
jgi:DnaJ family protein A protein 2